MHLDDHKFVGNFGAYGSGKTLTSREEIFKHIFITDNANVLIGARVTSQYEQTLKRELEADIPAAFVTGYSAQKSYMDIINGTRIMYRPLETPDDIRSYNLSMFVIVEASEVKAESYHLLKTRLRNTAAGHQKIDENGDPVFEITDEGVPVPVLDADWRRGLVESNPDSGWIRTDVLHVSDQINKHGHVLDDYTTDEDSKDENTSSHIASTDANKFLPKNYIKEQCANKPGWWIARFIYGSFAYAEGLVYPIAAKHFVPWFEIPPEWKRMMAFDYGLRDDAVFIWGAIDEKNGICYIYKEMRTSNRNVQELAQMFKEGCKDIPLGGWAHAPIIDPKSGPKRDYSKKSLIDLFLEEGIAFQPGYVNIDARIMRMNTYLESGRLKIMDNCTGLMKELREYKFPPRSLDNTSAKDKPIDKDNHGINPVEWICMALPADPKNLCYGVFNKFGDDVTNIQQKDNWMPHALRDDTDEESPYVTAEYAYGIRPLSGLF